MSYDDSNESSVLIIYGTSITSAGDLHTYAHEILPVAFVNYVHGDAESAYEYIVPYDKADL